MAEHVSLPDSELHEPKGVAGATTGQVYIADGAGSGDWTTVAGLSRMGWYDYNDAATTTTPINLAAGVATVMTNDGAGSFTNIAYPLAGVTNLWDTATDRFDFTGLDLGDTVDVRIDLEITSTGANHEFQVDFSLAEGSGGDYSLRVTDIEYKSAGTYQLTLYYGLYMGDLNTKDNPASIKVTSAAGGDTVVVNGWYIRAITR